MSVFLQHCRAAERGLLKRARAANVPVLILWDGPAEDGWHGLVSTAPGRTAMLCAKSYTAFYEALDRLHNAAPL